MSHRTGSRHELGDMENIENQRFRCPNVLFQPSCSGERSSGIHDTIPQSIMKCGVDVDIESGASGALLLLVPSPSSLVAQTGGFAGKWAGIAPLEIKLHSDPFNFNNVLAMRVGRVHAWSLDTFPIEVDQPSEKWANMAEFSTKFYDAP